MSRALLALLLARANRCVQAEQLVDELWQGAPPPSADGALRVHVSHLREAFGSVGCTQNESPIQFVNGGYQIVVPGGSFDVERFESGIRDGRGALAGGAPHEAADLLGASLLLWRGPAYQDFQHLGPLSGEGVRLAELRLNAIEMLADAHLAIDQPGWACELLEPEVREHPLRETLAERLMLALYRGGRPADALRACSRLRDALDEELGVLPGKAIRDLEGAIVIQSPELNAPRERKRPQSYVVTRDAPFVGRRVEARALDNAWESIRLNGSCVAMISGVAGIGKTALADQLARRATREGATVLVGHCDPDLSADYQPFPHLVRQAIARAPAGQLTKLVLGELRRLVPDLDEQLPPLPESVSASAGRERLFVAVNRLLECCPPPLLVLVEDLHWAGRGTLALLRHVAREHTGPIMVVANYREEEAGAVTPLGEALAAGRLAEPDVRIRLSGLSVAELKALLEMLAPEGGARVDVAELSELTGGNPLFVREVVRELGDNPRDRSLDDLAPDGIRTLVSHQLHRMTAHARDTLTIASMLGAEFSLKLLAATGKVSETAALAALDEALATRLIVETEQLDGYTFSHPLVRNIVYTSMSASRRARLHLRAGEILAVSTADGRWAEPARHFLAAAPLGDPAQTARYARRAGEDASERFAHDDAAGWYRSALALATQGEMDDDEEAETLLALGVALERGGDREAARTAYLDAAIKARSAESASLLADVAIAATPRYVTIDEFHPAQRELVDEALLAPTDEGRRARLLSCASASRYYDEDSADRPFAMQAIELAERSRDPEVRATGMLTYHRWLTHDPSAAQERAALSQDLLCLCEAESLNGIVGVASRELLVDLLSLGRFEQFDTELFHLDEIASTHHIPADRYWVSALRATRSVMQDQGGEAEGLVRAARTLGTRLQQTDAEGTFILQMFALRCQQGRSREIAAGLETPSGDQPRMQAGLALLASAFLAGGRTADARRILDQLLDGAAIRFPRDNMWLAATALIGGVAARVGSTKQRALCSQELLRFAAQWCVFGAGGAVFATGHHWLGELASANGDLATAIDHLTRARELAEQAKSPYWMTRAQTELEQVEAVFSEPNRNALPLLGS